MEVFELPLDQCTHLRKKIKQICVRHGYSFKHYQKQVYKLLDTYLGILWKRKRAVFRVLRDYGIADQRSEGWHQRRSEMITASEVTKAFKTASPSAKKELLMRKLEGPKESQGGTGIAACIWGTQFEPLAKEIYSDIQGGAEVVDTTCVVHPVHKFIGASPDGIVLMKDRLDYRWGKLVEFKCPISRKFTQESPIPNDYYHQMQLQMECTNIDECDYVEMEFKTCGKTEWTASTSPYKGVYAIYDNGKVDYKPKEMDYTVWRKSLEGEEFRILYWTLNNIRIENVRRDLNWMKEHLDDFIEFWKMVEDCRRDPSRIEHYIPTTVQPDAPSVPPLEVCESPKPASASSSERKTTIRLFLGDADLCDQEIQEPQNLHEIQKGELLQQ